MENCPTCVCLLLSAIMLAVPGRASASDGVSVAGADSSSVRIAAASVSGFRSLAGTGIYRTPLDSTGLRENISFSFADILAYNSSLFVKQYGRAALSTVSFRGTSPSHTQVLWNGMKINSPMLGMTDFSTIPAFIADRAELLHGPSSLQAVSGGLGGAVLLHSGPGTEEGFSMQFVQGIGSFATVDDFLRLDYGKNRFSVSLRAVFSYSPNRFRYVNMKKKENIYDENMEIISTYHPAEYNENGKYRDYHILLESGYRTSSGGRFTLSVWYLGAYRQMPRLAVDYSEQDGYINDRNENTLRAVLAYKRDFSRVKVHASAGYSGTELGYDHAFDAGKGHWTYISNSDSRANTLFFRCGADWNFPGGWTFRSDISLYNYIVSSEDIISHQGYDAARTDAGVFLSVDWKPVERLGLSLSVREDLAGNAISFPVPSLNAGLLLWREAGLYFRGSVSGNYRYPTLNDMYFLPGGNPDLKPETGVSYDAGYSFSKRWNRVSLSAEGAWYDSYIDDWILWLPYGTGKNYYTPVNLQEVHAYGVEQKVDLGWDVTDDLNLRLVGNYTWSPSINVYGTGRKGDTSAGKQLVYVPEHSASLMASLAFRSWKLLYKWCWYSRRYTMSSNDSGPTGSVPPYLMNGVTLSKGLEFRRADISLSLAVRNLFDENYETVLSRPMPGINYEFFIGITPKW